MLAAVNLGTLVLGRSIERVGEMALRTALGAARRRLIKQLVTEQAVLAVCGAVAGIVVARAALPALVSRIPPEVPHVGQIALDWTVLLSVLTSSVAVSIIVSLLPAALAARPNLQPLLRQARSTDTPGRRRALGSLVAVQIALAVVLGIGSMLMLRSLWNLQRVDPGFTATNVLTFRLQTTSKYRALSNGLPYLELVRERVAALPGVIDVGLTAHLPMSGYSCTTNARRSDRPTAPGEVAPTVGWRFIHGDYLRAMRIPLRFERAFETGDVTASTPVGLVNETMARQFFAEPSAAVGQTMVIKSGRSGQDENVQIVGVIGDISAQRPEPRAGAGAVPAVDPDVHVPDGDGGPHFRSANRSRRRCQRVRDRSGRSGRGDAAVDDDDRGHARSASAPEFPADDLRGGRTGTRTDRRLRGRRLPRAPARARNRHPPRPGRAALIDGDASRDAGPAACNRRHRDRTAAAFLLSRVMSSMLFGVTTHDPLTFAALPILIVAVTSVACYLPPAGPRASTRCWRSNRLIGGRCLQGIGDARRLGTSTPQAPRHQCTSKER